MSDDVYRFRLFVADGELESFLDEESLRALCAEHLSGRHSLAVIDVVRSAAAEQQADGPASVAPPDWP